MPATTQSAHLRACPIGPEDDEDFLRELDRDSRQSQDRQKKDELVVSELSTNALVRTGTSFTVSLDASEHTLLLEVEDGSRVEASSVTARGLDARGCGTTIVDLLSNNWGVDDRTDGCKSVWAEFSLL